MRVKIVLCEASAYLTLGEDLTSRIADWHNSCCISVVSTKAEFAQLHILYEFEDWFFCVCSSQINCSCRVALNINFGTMQYFMAIRGAKALLD